GFLHQASFVTGNWCYDRHCSVRLVICFDLAIDQIAQSGLSSLKVIYYSAQLFSLAPVPAIIVVFSTAGAMFLISMLAGLLFNVDPGSHRFIIMMTLTGVALVIIMNAALMSERPVWVISCLMIVLWPGIISHGRNKLLELAGKCHSEELWSPVRCAFTGALTLYYYFIGFFGILAAIAITLVWQRHTRFFH
ncbi:Bax inhibitor-1 family protein, partial [Shigella dysenteriae]|uniref:Bax inhibitor-1 family protein n=5 Tax=Shigella TaxID=620 RepID=UPI0036F1F094